MSKFSVITGLLLTLAAAGCSSSPPPAPQRAGALAAGTATAAIAPGGTSQFHGVACQPLGGPLTRITAGDSSTGLEMLLDNADGIDARSVVITNIDGFTGSFWKDAQGSATAGITAQTFTIEGTARGYNADNPSAATTRTFRIAVAC